MPSHALEALNKGKPVMEKIKDVPLIYGDIKGFTNLCANRSPNEVYNILSGIYNSIDKECYNLNCYKVHTIGDCYVASSYVWGEIGMSDNFKCLRVLILAIKMIEKLKEYKDKYDKIHMAKWKSNSSLNILDSYQSLDLEMRIGIHYGDIYGGIIGNDVVRYDIFGKNSTIANMAESNGTPKGINTTEAFQEKLYGEIAYIGQEMGLEDTIQNLWKSQTCFDAFNSKVNCALLREDKYEVLISMWEEMKTLSIDM